MQWKPRSFAIEIRRDLDVGKLVEISASELDEGANEGFLGGNRAYQDLRGFIWQDVEAALSIECAIVNRFKASPDLEAAVAEFEGARAQAIDEQDALWDLDVGVASAVIALSAIGTVPVSSCNAGMFGGHHVAAYPHAAFFLPRDRVEDILHYAALADVGLKMDSSGIAQIFGNDSESLIRFAEVALARHRARRAT